jgi:cytoskeleton protein RodZ
VSIGSALKQARESAGLTLEAVSDQTRMRKTMLIAIENDDFTLCGGDVYAKGHLRSVARVLNIDPAPLLAEFDAVHGGKDELVGDLVESAPMTMSKPRRNPWQPAMAVAGVALFAIIGIAVAQGESDAPTALPTPTPTQTQTTPATPAPTDEVPGAVANASDGVTFVVEATNGSSWLSVRDANGTQLYQGILSQGQTRTFQDDTNLRVVIGNAGGVDITVNGKPLGRAGQPGAVVRFNLTPGDPGIG